MAMKPETVALIASMAANAIGNVASSRSASKRSKQDAALTREEIAARERNDVRDLAYKESTLDPFRQQMSQAGAISKLDRMERGAYKPVTLSAPVGYEQYVPEMGGGFSYEKSPELVSSAGALKRNIMGGNVAPTMTDPRNYGSTAALDLVKIAADGVDPAGVSTSGARGARTGPVNRSAAAGPSGPYSYEAPDPNADLSVGFRENHAGLARAASGAATGASVAGAVGPLTAGAGAVIGAVSGAIKSRTNDTSNEREKFAQSQGFPDTTALWQHLDATLPPAIANELRVRALTRIGKHDKTANARWMADVAGTLANARMGPPTSLAGPQAPSYTGRG